MDYPGKVITKTQVTPTQTSASGNWTLDDQAAAIKNNNWPVALVPNPISKSLRFNSADSAYLSKTFSTNGTGGGITVTFSAWVKRGTLGSFQSIIGADSTAGTSVYFAFNSSNNLEFGQGATIYRVTNGVFRDPSAWYHVVLVWDSSNATDSLRCRIYVNGTLQTYSTSTSITLNTAQALGYARAQGLGADTPTTGARNYFNGYMTEINFIDGQALTPSDFGLTNPQTGQWIPKKYTGTYGTNGFYLNFKDATSTTTLGYDYSGNANNWTTNNFSVTAGSGNDSLTDVPTPWTAYNTTGDVGGVVRGNYCTPNPLDTNSALLFANGNLDLSNSSGVGVSCRSTFQMASGKWYWEFTVGTAGTYVGGGIGTSAATTGSYTGDSGTSYGYLSHTGNKYNSGAASSYGATFTNGDVIGISFDSDAGTLIFYKNGSSQGTAFSSLTGGTYFPMFSARSGSISVNFGQRPFAYTPPAGFRSLCTTNLPATAIGFGLTNQANKYMNAVLYTGNGSTQSITGVGFQPDFSWLKARSSAISHGLFDAVRGAGKALFSNATNAEFNYGTTTSGELYQFTSDGFNLGSFGNFNVNGVTNVAWNWKAGGTGVSNTAGTITSTVSANTTSGFSIVTYTGTGSAATVGHGLGVAPSMIIVKVRSTTNNWATYHAVLGNTKALLLDTTDAQLTSSLFWNNTSPTSSVFSVSTGNSVNNSGQTYVAYCFAAVAGYSAFGSYTGNGSADGPFIYTGFRPRYVMWKEAAGTNAATSHWLIHDAARNPENIATAQLYANLSNAEDAATTGYIDILSNGFKFRTAHQFSNESGGTYIYAAFAESPFQFSNAR